ncbi:MAG: restriction endonuclease subunit S, partial [Synergistaceae bacterium]|nr:restriction endonuclease subunit S [Synergistaceae bacterium]
MKEKGLVPKRRFGEYEGDSWKTCFFKDSFSYITNNSLSRAKLNYKKGIAKNIHYGDILIKYGEVLNVEKSIVPFISDDEEAKKLLPSSLRDGDIIFADAAEDETVGKCSQLINVNDENIVSGLHTITYRPEIETSLGFLGYYFNSTAYRKQIMGLMQGTKVLAISKSTLEGTSLIIPPTISEQKKISSFF